MSEQEIPRPQGNREIATTGDGMDITRGYTGPLLLPTDSVLRNRGGYDLQIYEQVYSNHEVKATFQQRQLAVTRCEWQVEPGGKRAIDKAAADFLREQLHAVGWDNVTTKMLFGVFYGYAVAEIVYKPGLRFVEIDRIIVRNRRRFRYGEHGELRLLTTRNRYPGEEAPKPYFWDFCVGADNDDEPYGLALAHWLYWPDLFMRNDIKFWLIFLEKFGMPTAAGKYDPDASDVEKSRLLQAVRAIQTDSGIIMPKGMEVELLEAARSGTADYQVMYNTMCAAIQKVVLGQTASTQGTPGKLGNDELAGDVREDIVTADADLVCESFNRGPARWLTQWNFPGAEPPRVYRVTQKPEDLAKRAERDERVSRMGFKPKLVYITETYGEGWEEAQPAPPSDPGGASFAEPPPAPGPDALIADQLDAGAQPIIDGWVDTLDVMVQRAGSLPELREMLLAAYGDLPADQLAPMIAGAMQAAQAAGRADLQDQSGG